MSDFDYLLTLPGEERERHWLQERLETLSVRESITLAAAALRSPPEDMEQAINQLQSLDSYTVQLNAGSYAALGEAELHRKTTLPDSAMPFVNLTAMGHQYEIEHPGLFVGDCYVPGEGSPASLPARRAAAGGQWLEHQTEAVLPRYAGGGMAAPAGAFQRESRLYSGRSGGAPGTGHPRL